MKKLCVILLLLAAALSVPALAAERGGPVRCYDTDGRLITVDGVYYDAQGTPRFGAGCYYAGDDGQPVFVGGCRVYYSGRNGDLVRGRFCYDPEGRAVLPPSSYAGGCGYGAWRQGDDGVWAGGSFYYDDFGNLIEAPEPAAGRVRIGRGGCCGR